jgi:hypothetical protein
MRGLEYLIIDPTKTLEEYGIKKNKYSQHTDRLIRNKLIIPAIIKNMSI